MGVLADSAIRIVTHFGKPDNTSTFVTLAALFVLYLLYKWAVQPCNRVKRLGDLGLYFDEKLKGKYKERQLERLIKLRKVGDLPPVYPNGWYCIAESDQVKPGEIKEITVFGQLVSLVRSHSGKVFVMESYCPHLGANFNVGGKVVNDNCVQCPFHGWIFSAETGKCTTIPYSDHSIPEQAKVATWPAVEKNAHVYIWFHCDGEDPTWEVPEIPQIDAGEWTFGGRTEHEIMCHCQEIPENGADIAHLNYLHLSGPNDGHNILKFELQNTKPMIQHCWTGSWEHGSGDVKHLGTMHLDQYLTFYGMQIPLTTSSLKADQHGPGIVVMNFNFGALGRGVVLQHVTPEEPLLQRVRFKMFSTCPLWFCKFFLTSEALQFERDIYVWSNKKYIRNPLVVKNDGPILKHRRWYSQFYTENSPRMLPNGEITNKPKSVNDW